MKKLSKEQRIKIIKENLSLATDKLAKKLKMKSGTLLKFCSRNNISLSKDSKDNQVLKFIKNNPTLSIGVIAYRTGYNKESLNILVNDNNIIDDRFRKMGLTIIQKIPSKKLLKKEYSIDQLKKEEKIIKKNKVKLIYEKISHEKLNHILLSADSVSRKFVTDLGALGIGEALHIKKENWSFRHPALYFKQMLAHTKIRVKVKTIGDDYYVIRLM